MIGLRMARGRSILYPLVALSGVVGCAGAGNVARRLIAAAPAYFGVGVGLGTIPWAQADLTTKESCGHFRDGERDIWMQDEIKMPGLVSSYRADIDLEGAAAVGVAVPAQDQFYDKVLVGTHTRWRVVAGRLHDSLNSIFLVVQHVHNYLGHGILLLESKSMIYHYTINT